MYFFFFVNTVHLLIKVVTKEDLWHFGREAKFREIVSEFDRILVEINFAETNYTKFREIT